MREAEIQADIRKALGAVPGLVCWRNNVGQTGHDSKCPNCGFVQQDEDGPRIKYGLCPGSSDIVCIMNIRNVAFPIFLEVKTPKGKQSPAQELFQQLVEKRGAFYLLCRSVEDALEGIRRAREHYISILEGCK